METESKQVIMKMAAMYYKAGRYEMAVEECKKALALDRNYIRAHHGLSRSLASLRMHKEALESFRWVLAYDCLSNALYSELYKQRGDVYYEMQDFLNALDDYDRALRLNPKNEEATRMRTLADKYHLQQRAKLGKDDMFLGYPPYFNEADVYASNGYKFDEYNDEEDEDESRFEDITDDYEREEWEEEYEAEYIEYIQDWDIYTEAHN